MATLCPFSSFSRKHGFRGGSNGVGVGKVREDAPFATMLQSLPPAFAQWFPLAAWGVVSVFQGVIWMELKAVEARLRNEQQASEARLRGEQQASEARQVKRTDELRADIKVLGEKIDRLVEIFATAKPA